MREIILFIASIAGAAIFTALAVLVAPESPSWRWVLWVGIAVFTACASVLIIDYARPCGAVIFLVGIGMGIALLVVSAIAFFVAPLSALPPSDSYPLPAMTRPSVLLLWENKQLRLHNRGDADIYIWGDKVDNTPKEYRNSRAYDPREDWFLLFPERQFRQVGKNYDWRKWSETCAI
jgi:hypothetical protein